MKVKVCGIEWVGDVFLCFFVFFLVCSLQYVTDIWGNWAKPPSGSLLNRDRRSARMEEGDNKANSKTGEKRETRQR